MRRANGVPWLYSQVPAEALAAMRMVHGYAVADPALCTALLILEATFLESPIGMSGAVGVRVVSHHHREQLMKLILSCIVQGEDQTRRLLDRLMHVGIAGRTIVIVHPGKVERLQALAHSHADGSTTEPATTTSTGGAAASGSTVGGMFGWVVGYGVLSLPGALLGGAMGAVAGAAIGAGRHALAPHMTDEVQHHYASRIIDDHAAVLVQVEDARQYENVLIAFLKEGGRHILTSHNDRTVAESAQLEVMVHHPQVADEEMVTGRQDGPSGD